MSSPERERFAAETLFQRFLESSQGEGRLDFDTFCEQHLDLADELRSLYTEHESGSSASAPASQAEDHSFPDSEPGDVIGQYKLVSVLGKGGFGSVFLAEQEQPFHRKVALKIIKLGMDTREVIARFEAERQALALMNHPNIASAYDAGCTQQGRPYFVMEYVPGLPITDYCDQHCLSIHARLELFIHVCDAVQHAHQKAIIHRDIKPSNVLITTQDDGTPLPKVIDFGLAKALNEPLTDVTMVTQQGQFLGTPAYMSPEQWETSALDIDTGSDIYSLGALLYELVTGVLPFDLEALRKLGFPEMQRIVCQEQPPTVLARVGGLGAQGERIAEIRQTELRSLKRQLRGDLEWITLKALEKDRSQRYATASEFAQDIKRHLNHQPVLARAPTVSYRVKKLVRRHRGLVRGAVAIIVLLAVLGCISWYRSHARLQRVATEATKAIDAEDLELAKAKLSLLQEEYGDSAVAQAIQERVTGLTNEFQIRRSGELRSKAEVSWSRYRDLKGKVGELETRWRDEQKKLSSWAPVWERHDELNAWTSLQEARQGIDDHYNQAVLSLHKALETAPPESVERMAVQRLLEGIYKVRHDEAEAQGAVSLTPSFFRRMIETYGVGTYDEDLEGGSEVSFVTTPPGATVYCFRYDEIEAHLVPRPFNATTAIEDLAASFLGRPFLRVERVWDTRLSPFLAGDRLLRVQGKAITTRGELAMALSSLEVDEAVSADVLREQEEKSLSWIPFPSWKYDSEGGGDERLQPGHLSTILFQLGLTFEGYPLEFLDGCRVGVTQAENPVRVELPKGSYLFVLRKEGFRDVRVPVSTQRPRWSEEIRLLRETDIPPGFVYIPSGIYCSGGDNDAEQSLGRDDHVVDGFLIGELEVTLGEWLEFINDPEVFDRTNDNGRALPVTEAVKNDIRSSDGRVSLVHRYGTEPLWTKDKGERRWVSELKLNERGPALGISHHAALEYAHWRTMKEGGRWTYRMPTDLEWEKAARGVDRRTYVWGNYRVWSFCASQRGKLTKTPAAVGTYPLDESVYGVRDLAGSNSEHTTGRTVVGLRFRAYRGGSWNTTDDQYFRIASRNGMLPESAKTHFGLRLVVDLDPAEE